MSQHISALSHGGIEHGTAVNGRTAVLFYGMLRNFETGADTIKRNVLYGDQCDAFYFGPRDTDKPDVDYAIGLLDKDGFFLENPKEKVQITELADTQRFLDVYKKFIVKAKFHDMVFSQFEAISASLRPREDWMMGLNPARMISMFYNMGGVIDMFLDHVGSDLDKYDQVIITRTDLIIYSRIACSLTGKDIHIPFGEGFSVNGVKHTGNAPVLYYKNMLTGDYVPGGRTASFNDQIMVLSGKDLPVFRNLFKTATSLIRDLVPLSPETILYIICKRHSLTIETHDEWQYEIYRDGKRHIESLLDTPDLEKIDRYNPRLLTQVDDRPVKTTSDILDCSYETFDRLRKRLLLHPVLMGQDVSGLSNQKILSFMLGSEKMFVGIAKKSLLQDLSNQNVHIFTIMNNDIHSQCATQVGQKSVILPRTACHALYGPYIRLEPGRYTAEFIFDEIEGDRAILDVSSPANTKIAEQNIKIKGNTVLAIDWDLREAHEDLEIRLFALPGFKGIFEYLLIKKK